MERTAWLLLQFEARQYAGNLGYQDQSGRAYQFDSFVPNCRRLEVGDLALLRDEVSLLGLARIEAIHSKPGTKERLACPECSRHKLKARSILVPRFRCECGHVFDEPLRRHDPCTIYRAEFGDTFVPTPDAAPLDVLRGSCPRYNPNLAMQPIDLARVTPMILMAFPRASIHLSLPAGRRAKV